MKKSILPVVAITFIAFLFSCKKSQKESITERETTSSRAVTNATNLSAPVAESKIYKLMKGYDSGDKFEASGVYYNGGYYYVVCDNLFKIAKINSTLTENSTQNSMLSSGSGDSGFEGITLDNNNTLNFFVAEEAVKNGSVYQPRIREYDASMVYQTKLWAEYNFTSGNANKGFEGISWVYRGVDDYILGLVEGTGKVIVLKKTSTKWAYITEMNLPSTVTFNDYSDIAVYGNKVAITSQEDAQIWIGTLSGTSWQLSGGTTYNFPKGSTSGVVGAGSNILYGNVEGVSFISDTQIVVVSDKVKDGQPSYQSYKDQSIHIFNLP